jgi:acetyl esterase/lipase
MGWMKRGIGRLAAAFLILMGASAARAADPEVVSIWPHGAPGAEARVHEPEVVENTYVRSVHNPNLTVFRADPARANGAAVVIAPGGGHRMLVFVNEGIMPAKRLNQFGITVFVLKYRLAREAGSTYSIEGDAAADARRAVRWVRAYAADYGVDPHRVGLMGFSAGGELVSMVADNPEPARGWKLDAVDQQSARPDFQILVYPGPLGVPGKAVAGAPPAFITAGALDTCCEPPSMALFNQLREAKVPAELHIFASTDHGFNVAMHNDRVSIQHWPDRLFDWLSDEGWLVARR